MILNGQLEQNLVERGVGKSLNKLLFSFHIRIPCNLKIQEFKKYVLFVSMFTKFELVVATSLRQLDHSTSKSKYWRVNFYIVQT